MRFDGRFTVVSSRVKTTKTGQSLMVFLSDVDTGTQVAAFLPADDKLGSVRLGTLLHVSGDLRRSGDFLNVSGLTCSELEVIEK